MSIEKEEMKFTETALNVARRIVQASGDAPISVRKNEVVTMAAAIYMAEEALASLAAEDQICADDLNPIFQALHTEVEQGFAL